MNNVLRRRDLTLLHDDRIDYERKMSSTKIIYDPDGWMMTDNNEVIAVARDSSYKEIVRHGKSMVSLLLAEIYEPPINIVPYYEREDPMHKNTHGPQVTESKSRRLSRTPDGSTRRNYACKLLSRRKKQHPKYIYQRLSVKIGGMDEEPMKPASLSSSTSPLPPKDDVQSLRIRIPPSTIDEEEEEEHELQEYLREEQLWNQMYWDSYYGRDY
jgi:hypothetical protein